MTSGDPLPLPAAVMWDMDGTMVDTEPYWIEAETALAAEAGAVWTHADGISLVGKALPDAAAELQRRTGLVGEIPDIVDRLVGQVAARLRANGVPWRPGAAEFLAELHSEKVPCALVTMSYANLAHAVVDSLPPGTFDVVVSGDMVQRGKPHPEPYLMAADLLGVPANKCVVFEDSPPGIASAEASGATTVGVLFMVPIPASANRSRIHGLDQMNLNYLRRIHAGEVIDLLDEPYHRSS